MDVSNEPAARRFTSSPTLGQEANRGSPRTAAPCRCGRATVTSCSIGALLAWWACWLTRDVESRPGQSRLLFKTSGPATGYGVGRDGRFLMIQNLPPPAPDRPITVVLNWFQELKQ